MLQCMNASEKNILVATSYSFSNYDLPKENKTIFVYNNCSVLNPNYSRQLGININLQQICDKTIKDIAIFRRFIMVFKQYYTKENVPLLPIRVYISCETKKLIIILEQCYKNQIRLQDMSNSSIISTNESISIDLEINRYIEKNFSVINSQNQKIAIISIRLKRNIYSCGVEWKRIIEMIYDKFNTTKNLTGYSKVLNTIEQIRKQKNPISKLTNMVQFLKDLSENSLMESFPENIKKNISSQLLKSIKLILVNLTRSEWSTNETWYLLENESLFFYMALLNNSLTNFSIPINRNKTENKTEFFNLSLANREGPPLVTNFLLFKNIDMLKEKLTQSKFNVKSSTNKNNVYRFKNSDIFHLSLNEATNLTVKFKMKKNVNIESYRKSWLYTLENECSYLMNKSNDWEWAVDGCKWRNSFDNGDYCECNHLSNFALVATLIVNEEHKIVTRYLSIIGGVINIISLFLFLLFVLVINSRDKMRLDQLNIAICLLIGTFVFLIGVLFLEYQTLCKIVALFSQFMFLSAFMWKLMLGINVVRGFVFLKYRKDDWLVKYRNEVLVTCYTVPLVIVIISGIKFWNHYTYIVEHKTCWIKPNEFAFFLFYVPIGIILGINSFAFLAITVALIRNYINTRKTRINKSNELLIFIQLFVSMGLAWFPSYFANISIVAMYMFLIFFPLQGLLIFLFVVVINKENRLKVSSFVRTKYLSLTNKSTSSGVKSDSKFKTNSHSLEKNVSLLTKINQNDDHLAKMEEFDEL